MGPHTTCSLSTRLSVRSSPLALANKQSQPAAKLPETTAQHQGPTKSLMNGTVPETRSTQALGPSPWTCPIPFLSPVAVEPPKAVTESAHMRWTDTQPHPMQDFLNGKAPNGPKNTINESTAWTPKTQTANDNVPWTTPCCDQSRCLGSRRSGAKPCIATMHGFWAGHNARTAHPTPRQGFR